MPSISSSVTRGLVISTKDPLFSGRVKVWIPAIHGAPKINKGDYSEFDDDGESREANSIDSAKAVLDLQNVAINDGQQSIWENEDALPWAMVLGHNWGPIGDLFKGTPLYKQNQPNGVMSVPKVGTEVFLMFEDDNPDQPVIIGSVYHKDELLALSSPNPLELAPGIRISSQDVLLSKDGTYDKAVSDSYVIRSVKGSSLIISDIEEKEQIILGGSIPFNASPGNFINTSPDTSYFKYAQNYPNFPTTASSPFASRQSLSNTATFTKATFGVAKQTTSSPTAVTTTTTNIPLQTTTQAQAAKFKSYPVLNFTNPDPKKDMQFKAPRDGGKRLHLGVDLGTEVGNNLLAPAKGQVLAYSDNSNGSGGKWLIFKDAYGCCHRFMHLDSISESVKTNVIKKTYPYYEYGTILGATGATGKRKDGRGYTPHLHWEVLSLSYKGVNYFNEVNEKNIASVFSAAKYSSGTMVEGTSLYLSTDSYLDPLKWIIADTGASLILNGNQAALTYQAISQSSDTAYDKIIGLEVCMTPGMEHIFIRHSSGGFFGFDADGNFKLFANGDIQVRSNRSAVIDIFGTITTSALATFSRIKTLIRTVAASFSQGANAASFTPYDESGNSMLKDSTTYDTFPQALYEIDVTRLADMSDSLTAIQSQVVYTDAITEAKKFLNMMVKEESSIVLNADELQDRSYTNTQYDALIKSKFDTYFGPKVTNNRAITLARNSKLFNWKLFKAQMLQESNGNASAVSKAGAVGLFQLLPTAVRDVKGILKENNKPVLKDGREQWIFDITGADMNPYRNPEINIDTALQFYKLCLEKIYSKIETIRANKNLTMTDLTQAQIDSIVKIALLSYNTGYSEASKQVARVLDLGGPSLISYAAMEKQLQSTKASREKLTYVPIIVNHILPNIT